MKKSVVVLAAVLVVAAAVAIGGFAYGYQMENNDAFCASCHTEPESTYYERTKSDPNHDLAAWHSTEETRCIDCHSEKGLSGRAGAMLLGARDMIAFRTGNYVQPVKTTKPLNNSSCTKCHSFSFFGGEAGEGPSVDGVRGHDGHYHIGSLLTSWRLRGGPVNACASCHPAHVAASIGDYRNNAVINQGCDACHAALGEGGREGGDD